MHEPSVCSDQDFWYKVSNVFFPEEYDEGLDAGCLNKRPTVYVGLPEASGRPSVKISGKQSTKTVTAAAMPQSQVVIIIS